MLVWTHVRPVQDLWDRAAPHAHRAPPTSIDEDARSESRPFFDRGAEGGVIVVMVCVSLLGILMLGMLIASGSLAYSQRRNAQNATDASASAGSRALDQALFFGGAPEGVAATVQGLVNDHKAQDFTCWLLLGDGARMVYPATGEPVPCSDTATIRAWRDHLAQNPPTTAQPAGVEVIVLDRKPALFGGLNGISDTVTARAGAKATIQTVTEVSAPWVVCANPAYGQERSGLDVPADLLTTTVDGPDVDTFPDFVWNADGTIDVDPEKATAANALNGGKGIGLDGPKVAECGAGANFDGKGVPNLKFRLPGIAAVQQGTGYSSLIQDQVVSINPCPTPLPPVLDGCEILVPMAISGANMQVQLVAAGVFSVTGTGNGQYGYYGKYVGKAQFILGTHTTTAPVSSSSLRVIRLIDSG